MMSRGSLSIVSVLGPALCCYLLTTANSFSYIDPGTGSYIIQIIIASVLAVLTLSRIYWSRLKAFFGGIFAKQSSNESKK